VTVDSRHPALVAGSSTLSYGELEELIRRRAGQLRAVSVEPGDRIGVLAANGVEFALLAHAIPRMGGVLVLLNTRLADPELGRQMEAAELDLLLVDDEQASRSFPVPTLRIEELGAQRAAAPPPREDLPEDRAATILFTSGTTGRPKGAVLTWANHEAHARACAEALDLTEADRWLLCLPLFHVGGLEILYRCARAGATVLLQERFEPGAACAGFDAQGATFASFVAVMLGRVLDARAGRPLPDSARGVIVGGGPVPQDLTDRCPQALATYGLTEACSAVTLVRPGATEAARRSAGLPLPGMEVAIEEGEIVIRGPSVMRGYLGEARREATDWFRTGDHGFLDEHGRLHVLGRREDLILSGGENIYPAEIEEALRAHPAVREAVVVAVADEHWGARPVAFVVPASGSLDPFALREDLRASLAGFKLPRVRVVDAIPRLANGKPDRGALARRAGQEAGGGPDT
jgi:O-succinylbenzoic acid--CoA ligase